METRSSQVGMVSKRDGLSIEVNQVALQLQAGELSDEFFSILDKSFFKSFIRVLFDIGLHQRRSGGHRQGRHQRRSLPTRSPSARKGISHQAKHETKDGSREAHSAGRRNELQALVRSW